MSYRKSILCFTQTRLLLMSRIHLGRTQQSRSGALTHEPTFLLAAPILWGASRSLWRVLVTYRSLTVATQTSGSAIQPIFQL